jgi:prepilin-type processing-associated H-X9-DG protein
MAGRGRHTLALAAALLCMATATVQLQAAGAPPAGAGDLSREVPENSFFYLQFSGFAPLREPFQSTALNAIWQEPEVQTLLAQPLADFKGRIEAGTSNWPLLWPEVCDLLDGPAAFAVFPGAGEKAEPGGVLIAQPKDADRFRSALVKLIESGRSGKLGQVFEHAAPAQPAPAAKAAPAAPPAPYTVGSVTVTPLTAAPDSPAYCFLDGLFLLGMDKGSLETYLSWRSAAGRTPLSSAKAYTDMVAKLQPTGAREAGATVLAYLNVPGLIQAVGTEMTEEQKKTLTALAVDRLDWLGVTVTCDPPGWRTRLFLTWHGEATGLLGLLPRAAVPEELLALVPKESLMALALNLNAAEFYDRLRALVGTVNGESAAAFDENMAAFAQEFGFDLREGLLAPLGHDFLLYPVRTPLSAFGFDVVLLVRGTDEKKLGPTLDLLVAYLRQQLEARGGGVAQTLDAAGHTLYSLRFAMGGPPVAPSVAVVPNYVVASLYPGTARAAMTALTATQPQSELSLPASDSFKAVRAKLPTNGAFITYVDAGRSFEVFYPGLVTLLTAFGQALPLDLSLLPQPQTISKHLGGSLAVVSVEPQGLRVEQYSPTVIHMGFSPEITAVGAATLLPALARAREEARVAVCRTNLKQLGLAMAIYANDHDDKFPPALTDLIPKYLIDEGLLHCPSDESQVPSYLYVPGLSLASEPTVMVVIERGDIHPGRRNVLFVDGHAESMREEAFQAQWVRQQEKLNLPSLKELGDTAAPQRPAPAASPKEEE